MRNGIKAKDTKKIIENRYGLNKEPTRINKFLTQKTRKPSNITTNDVYSNK